MSGPMPDLTPAEQRTLTDEERADWVEFIVNAATYVMGAMAEQTVGARDRGEDWQQHAAGEALDLFMPHIRDLLTARHTPAADHTATLDRVHRLLTDPDDTQWWPVEPYMDPPNDDEVVEVEVLALGRLRVALDGDPDQCGDPTCDDEHGGGA